jgi:uncharacterized protein YndB with AHSA1/START domain
MKELRQTIIINKPIEDVFALAINPANTPQWVEPVTLEQTNEWPVKVGSVYRSQNRAGEWSELTVTELEVNAVFCLGKADGSRMRYEFTSIDTSTTKLDYTWASNGTLDEQFLTSVLTKLKAVLESDN